MRFRLYTLVDITETRARRGDDPKQMRQQQNFLTVLQTIGLRVNPTYLRAPELKRINPSTVNLGKKYKNKHNVWEFVFDIDYEGALDINMLLNDFNLIPFIDGLDETVQFDKNIFITQDPNICNIFFEELDK